MNKKILVVSILAVFTLVAISFASAINTQDTSNTPRQKGYSPLFGIRTRRAIGDRLLELRENIKARFIGQRLFFLPFQWLRDGLKIHHGSGSEPNMSWFFSTLPQICTCYDCK